MTLNPRRFVRHLLAGLLPVTALALSACDVPGWRDIPAVREQPERLETPEPEEVALAAGPWFSTRKPGTLTVSYRTDAPVGAGVRLTGPGPQKISRHSDRTRVHVLNVDGLAPGAPYRCDTLIPNGPAVRQSVRTLPEAGPAMVVLHTPGTSFAGPGRTGPGTLHLLRGAPENAYPDGAEGIEAMGLNEAGGRLLLHMPGPLCPRDEAGGPLLAGAPCETSYRIDCGAMTILCIDPRELAEDETFRLLHWMRREFSEAADLRVVVLPQVLADAKGLRTLALQRFGPVFESYGVQLVVSTGADQYHRTVPLGEEGGVVYLSVPDAPPSAERDGASFTPQPYTAAAADDLVALGVTSGEEGLSIAASRPEGETVDEVLLPQEQAAELKRTELVTTAWAHAAQKHEVQAIARQAARAVPDPDDPGTLRFYIANPSPLPLEGTLEWIYARTRFRLEPPQLSFEVAPGEAVRSVFQVEPAEGEGTPELVVRSSMGHEARQQMVLVKERTVRIPRVAGAYIPDGDPEEPFWKRTARIEEFFRLGGTPERQQRVRAWIAAGTRGLRVRWRCAVPGDLAPAAAVKRHDGPVWRDESVEIYIDTQGLGRAFYQLSLNTAGTALDAFSHSGRRWSPEWKRGVRIAETHYDVEALIPWKALGRARPPAPGEKWGINLVRNDYTAANPRVYQAAPTHGSNARAGMYLRATFE